MQALGGTYWRQMSGPDAPSRHFRSYEVLHIANTPRARFEDTPGKRPASVMLLVLPARPRSSTQRLRAGVEVETLTWSLNQTDQWRMPEQQLRLKAGGTGRRALSPPARKGSANVIRG